MKRKTRLRPQREGKFFGPVADLSLGTKRDDVRCDRAKPGWQLQRGRCILYERCERHATRRADTPAFDISVVSGALP